MTGTAIYRHLASTLRRLLASTMVASLAAGPVAAQAAAPAPVLRLELNAAQPSQKGCRLTFVVENRLAADIERMGFELALFDDKGVVERLTVLEFKDMPAGKTKVSRFDLSSVDCGKIGRILINHASDCVGAGVGPSDCMQRLETVSRAPGIAFGT
jgi:hypothetical protein